MSDNLTLSPLEKLKKHHAGKGEVLPEGTAIEALLVKLQYEAFQDKAEIERFKVQKSIAGKMPKTNPAILKALEDLLNENPDLRSKNARTVANQLLDYVGDGREYRDDEKEYVVRSDTIDDDIYVVTEIRRRSDGELIRNKRLKLNTLSSFRENYLKPTLEKFE